MANVVLRDGACRMNHRKSEHPEGEQIDQNDPRGQSDPRDQSDPRGQSGLSDQSEQIDQSGLSDQSELRDRGERIDPSVRIVFKRIQKWGEDHLDANAMAREVLADRLGTRIEIPVAGMHVEIHATTRTAIPEMKIAARIEGKSVARRSPVATRAVVQEILVMLR